MSLLLRLVLPPPWIEFNCADYATRDICDALALHERILMHPVNSTLLLCGYQLAAKIDIATIPLPRATSPSYFPNYLPTQQTGPQIVSGRAVVSSLGTETIAVVVLLQEVAGVARCGCLAGGVVREILPAIR